MSPGDIATLATAMATLLAAIGGLLKAYQAARHVQSLHQEVRPPSNGTTAGAITEGTATVVSWTAHELLNLIASLNKEPATPPPPSPLTNPAHVPPRPDAPPLGPNTPVPPTTPGQ